MRFNEKEMAYLACTCEADLEGLLDKRGKGSTKGSLQLVNSSCIRVGFIIK